VQAQLPAETRDYVPAVIAAAWLFLHPKKYGLEFPTIDTTPGQFTVTRATSVNELTICLGNGGTRDGFFRVLRNLNPRYEASAVIPAGTMLRAPRRAAALYTRNCVQGPRAELAQQLGRANREWMPAGSTLYAGSPSTSATVAEAMAKGDPSKQRSSERKKRTPASYKVRPGDSLIAIASKHGCDVSDLAKANKLKSPAYKIKPGQRLKLAGCEG
jgi:membrane-bound lytic murein transglycosylase D